MSRVYVRGIGAVSPAGWGLAALRDAVAKGQPLPMTPLERPGWGKPLNVRVVPPPSKRLDFLAHPRMRRSNPLTQYAAAAALEALGAAPARKAVGLVFCMQSGPVQYAARFYAEAVKDPATASPLLFPETVFAAPASHVAALLGEVPVLYTLAGDAGTFLQAIALGIEWLNEARVEALLVIGAEELNWLPADALRLFSHGAAMSAGAGALCLTLDSHASIGVELSAITDVFTYGTGQSQTQAARLMRKQLGSGSSGELLCDGTSGNSRFDAAERIAWLDWSGTRLSLKRLLGEGLMAACAWQCVAAADAVARGACRASTVSIVGLNQQAVGARFVLASEA